MVMAAAIRLCDEDGDASTLISLAVPSTLRLMLSRGVGSAGPCTGSISMCDVR